MMQKETRGRKRKPVGDFFKFHVSMQRKVVTDLNGIVQPKYILYWGHGFRDVSEIQKHPKFEVISKPLYNRL